ncbi:MAG: hypothetical protein AAGG55_05710 [Pseudomonadota bacterium]
MLEPALASYLVARGHKVTVLLCDKALPACLTCSIWKSKASDKEEDTLTESPADQGLCEACFPAALRTWETSGAEVLTLSSLLTSSDKAEVRERCGRLVAGESVVLDGTDFKEDVVAGCLRYLCKGDEESISTELFRRYAEASMMIARAYKNFLSSTEVDCGVWVHGIYVPHGVLNRVFRSRSLPFLNYNTSYRQSRFYFVENDTYHHVFPGESADELGLDKVTGEEIGQIEEYLRSRASGSNDWQQFNNEPLSDTKRGLRELGFTIDDRPTAVMYTNVVWDARLHFRDSVYDRMEDWIADTVEYFRVAPHRKLILRVHPGELISHSVSRSRVVDHPALQDLPENITVVGADSKISSYDLADIADLILVFATKMSMELGRYGKPIICCGDAWVRGKGATIDPVTPDEYLEKLGSQNWQYLYDPSMRDRAIAYSHYIFEEKPIAFPIFDVSGDRKSFTLNPMKLQIEASKTDSSLADFEEAVRKVSV